MLRVTGPPACAVACSICEFLTGTRVLWGPKSYHTEKIGQRSPMSGPHSGSDIPLAPRAKTPILSLDVLRIAAMALVAVRHATSIGDVSVPRFAGMLDIGQIGVSIFCVLSGYMTLVSKRSTTNWIVSRLTRVFPAYWIALSVVLIANAVVGYKPMSLGLILSQFSGIALFTHPGKLVGVHFWFISLLLVC